MTDRNFCSRVLSSRRPTTASRRSRRRQGLKILAAAIASLAGGNHAHAATPSAAAALKLKPSQPGVQYELVDADAVDSCTVSDLEINDWNGWKVTRGDGAMLRRFADTNGDKKIDMWCYFRDGVEVYRDVDLDFNGRVDQCRWLGTAGTRWGLDSDEDGVIDSWKQISAEEVTAELVAAIRDADGQRFGRLLVTERELAAAGLGRSKREALASKVNSAARMFETLAKKQDAVGPKSKWVQFAAATPGTVPEGTDGSTKDVMVYENAVAMFDDDGESGQMLVGTLLKVGDSWRLIGLPSVGSTEDALAQAPGVFFGSAAGAAAGTSANPGDPQTQELITALEAIDAKLAAAETTAEQAKLNTQRSRVIERLIESSDGAARENWVRQYIDTVSVAIQSDAYPGGLARLKTVAAKFTQNDQSLAAYARYQVISTEYSVKNSTEDDFAEIQKWYLGELTGLIKAYPRAVEAGQAMLQLALNKEFEGKESDAMGYYKQVAAKFGGTDAGKRAAGAVRRLDSRGKRIELAGKTLQGKTLDLASLRGRPIVVHYWASWCEPCKNDMKLLRRLQAQYAKAGLQIVGVNADQARAGAVDFLASTPLPWPQLFAPGGLEESPLATQYGVQILPTMMLVDKSGKIVRHNVSSADLGTEVDRLVDPR